jgi:hypothetical protein
MLGEAMHNYPEGYQEGPYCPQTKLIQIGALLAGIELTPETFCTEKMENPSYGGPYHGLESVNFRPAASCTKVNQELFQQLETVKDIVKLPPEKEVLSKINDAKDLKAKWKIFESYDDTRIRYEQRKAIIDRWRKVVFETSVGTTEDEKNVHFRQFKSADELSEDEIIHKVEQFKAALLKIVGHEENTGWLSGVVGNCSQAPTRHGGIAPPYL